MAAMHTEENIVDTYLRHFELKQDQDFWAFDEVNKLVRSDPETGWRVTRLLINKASSHEALAYVAAGPLEDLLNGYGLAVMDQVTLAARDDKRLQLALSGVWINRGSPVWGRWFALMNEFGFAEGRRTAL
jgi:hypothetical protein